MEEQKRGRGRPKVDTHLTEYLASSRRQAINQKYMFDAVGLLQDAADKITDSNLIWCSDEITRKAKARDGILEQIGRMLEQDHCAVEDCIRITNHAIDALKAGYKTKEIGNAIREIRMILRKLNKDPENNQLNYKLFSAVNVFKRMSRNK